MSIFRIARSAARAAKSAQRRIKVKAHTIVRNGKIINIAEHMRNNSVSLVRNKAVAARKISRRYRVELYHGDRPYFRGRPADRYLYGTFGSVAKGKRQLRRFANELGVRSRGFKAVRMVHKPKAGGIGDFYTKLIYKP